MPSYVLGGADAPSNKVNIAGIGVGGKGYRHIRNLGSVANIVALCDVDHKYAAKRFPNQVLNWNAADMEVTNHDETNSWVKRPRRKGWEL